MQVIFGWNDLNLLLVLPMFRAKFERAAQDFVAKYDLAGQGQQKRESQAKIQLNLLKQKTQNIRQGELSYMTERVSQ